MRRGFRYDKDHNLKNSYGISIYTYEHMLEEQGGVCAICKQPETMRRNNAVQLLAVDHDHLTGEVRGLLCVRCNAALGMMNDDTEILSAAIKYLKRS